MSIKCIFVKEKLSTIVEEMKSLSIYLLLRMLNRLNGGEFFSRMDVRFNESFT